MYCVCTEYTNYNRPQSSGNVARTFKCTGHSQYASTEASFHQMNERIKIPENIINSIISLSAAFFIAKKFVSKTNFFTGPVLNIK